MEITSEKLDLNKETPALCFFICKKDKKYSWLNKLNTKIRNTIIQIINTSDWSNENVSIIYTHGIINAERIVLIRLKECTDREYIMNAIGRLVKEMQHECISKCTIVLPDYFDSESTSSIIQSIELSSYGFDKYKKLEKKQIRYSIMSSQEINDIIKKSKKITSGVLLTRDISNMPPNDCNPSTIAKTAKELAIKYKMRYKIIEKKELKKQGFGGIIAVGNGSSNEPKLIILEYNKISNSKPIVIVGKAVTFDTGGISLKPSEKMDEMKFDKCGGCAVLGIMKAVAELKLSINVIGIIPTVENMPGNYAYRPGDIIKLYNGKTVEIINTDAEGRLILSDALAYGEKKYSPKAIIDLATLTGACIVALGNNVAGFLSNNIKLANEIMRSSKNTMEEIWQLPLNEDYKEMIKSNVADIKNIGPARAAGTITAGAFLSYAIKNTPWVHLDIAGTAWIQTSTKNRTYNTIGATGFGVRLIIDYLINSQ